MQPIDESLSYKAWLQDDRIGEEEIRSRLASWCARIVVSDAEGLLRTACDELARGIRSMLGLTADVSAKPVAGRSIVLGVMGDPLIAGEVATDDAMPEEGYVIRTVGQGDDSRICLAGKSGRGALYAVFHLLRLIRKETGLDALDIREYPHNGLRMINHWDNMDGSIERGYAGKSIFYRDGEFLPDDARIRDYARLLASVGINAISINNVNVHRRETELATEALLPDVARVAAIFRAYGIQTFLSINYASPIQLGGLDTADPLDPGVKRWWAERAAILYRFVPDFGGFVVKADSEFRPGPFTYGRDHADGANMLAEALEPFGGVVVWRCFVYNCLQDWRDRKTDRARAAYDHFKPLDGKFRPNVILQIKNGPMDFQVREPVSPLFGGLEKTNQLLELQITQEYTGQQKHLCYLVPQWKEVLDFDTHARGEGTTAARIASGAVYRRPLGGMAAVSNIGDDRNWTGHLLAQANLHGFARLAWNPALSADELAREWTALTFGSNKEVARVVIGMLLDSWRVYENYTAPLGVGWMVNPNHHYGPNVDGYEYSKWGTYHYADCKGIGVDRTVRSGTGYAGQYHPPVSDTYESLADCPDDLLLFFHHVPYTHRLQSGKTVIQHIYDTHFDGPEQARAFVEAWRSLEGRIDEERYASVLERLEEQAEHAKEWRDQLNTYFFRKSGIADERGRTIY